MAGLQWQQVEVNLAASMDQATTPFALPPALFQELRNARVYKNGVVAKRPGWSSVAATAGVDRLLSIEGDVFTLKPHSAGSPQVSAAIELGTLNNDGQRVDYHGGSLGSFSVSEIEILERRTLMRDIVCGDGSAPINNCRPDFAISSDSTIAVVAWEVSAAATPTTVAQPIIMAMAIDVRTRALVTQPTQINSPGGSARCLRPIVLKDSSTTIVVIFSRPDVNEIRGVIYNTTTRTFGTDTLIASNLNSLYRYDAAEYINSVGWYLMYRSTTPSIIFAYMNGLSITSSASLGEDADTGSVAVWASSDTNLLWMAWANTATGTRATVRSSVTLGTVVVAPTTMDGDPTNNLARMLTWAKGTGSWNILIWTVTAEGPTGYARPRSKFRALSTAGTKGNQQQCSDVCLISKGLSAANGYTYAAFLYDASDNNNTDVPYLRSGGNQIAFTMEVVDTTNAATGYASNSWRVAAVWALGEAGRERAPCTLSAFRSVLVNPSDGTLEHWFMLSPEYDQILIVDSNYAAGHPGVDLCRQRITPFPPIYAARIGKNVVFSGGVPQVWDGVSLNEYGFHYPPENSKMLDGGTVGTGLNAGLYGVQMTWEYRHATGDTARSAPTFALVAPLHSSLTLAAVNHKITVTLPTLGNSRKFNDTSAAEGLIVRAYRTEANGTVYHAEGDFASPSGFASNGSGPGALLTVTVQQPDATIETHPEIYTTDDLLSNFPPPALAYIHTHRNRLFGIMAERRTSVAFSHTYEDGELPGWHPDLVIDVPDECVALATIDEKLMILCKGGIYLISGNGPDRKGLNSDYDQPFRLNSPHGCISAASVRNFPSGIMYQSPTGFCLIDRQTNVTRVGGPVEDVLASFPFVHASCTIKDREWIYWSVLDRQYLESVSAGRVVAYDWRHNVWSVDQVPFVAGDDSHMVLSYVTSLATRGLDTFMTIQADPAVYKHTGSADPGPNWIYTYLRTAMLNLGSNSKFQRARWLTLLGQLKFVHQLALTVTTYHHATSAGLIQFFVWTYAQMSALQNYALKMHLQNQVGSFLQIELADGPDASAPTGYVDSAQWVTLLLEIGLKRGTMQSADAGME